MYPEPSDLEDLARELAAARERIAELEEDLATAVDVVAALAHRAAVAHRWARWWRARVRTYRVRHHHRRRPH